MRLPIPTILLALLAVAGACASDDAGAGDAYLLAGGEWTLLSAAVDGTDLAVPQPSPPVMTIEPGRVSGNAGCNSFGGVIEVATDGSLRLADVSQTEMACADATRMDFESRYLRALVASTNWSASPDSITLTGPNATLAYQRSEPPVNLDLEGTVWTFDTIFAGEGPTGTASTPDMSRPSVTLVIQGQNVTLASQDCGEFGFPLSYEPGIEGNIAIPENVRIGRPVCDDPGSNMVAAFDGVIAANGYTITENRLTFAGNSGQLVSFVGDGS